MHHLPLRIYMCTVRHQLNYLTASKKKKNYRGVSAVAQRDQQHLWSTGTQVRSPAQQIRLKDPVLLQLQCRSKLQLGSDPWPRNSIRCAVAKKEKKKYWKDTKSLTVVVTSSQVVSYRQLFLSTCFYPCHNFHMGHGFLLQLKKKSGILIPCNTQLGIITTEMKMF